MLRYFTAAILMALVSACASKPLNPGAATVEQCWGSRSHVDAVDCEDKVREELKTAMNRAYEKARKDDRELEQEFKAMHSAQYQGLEAALVDSQKAFLEYMDKECTYAVAGYGAGTGGADAYESCRIRLMTQRIQELGGRAE